jgi:hypothetical protein
LGGSPFPFLFEVIFMVAGDLTAGTMTYCKTQTELAAAINAINLAAATDFLCILPVGLDGWLVFKVQRA